MNQVDLNQIIIERPAYVVIEMDYKTKLILPFETGFEFIKTWASGIEILNEYNKPEVLQKTQKKITISFMTEIEFKALKLTSLLETPP